MKTSTFVRYLILSFFCVTFLGGCSNDDEDNTNLKVSQLPSDAQSFLSYHLPDISPLKIEKMTASDPEDGENYKVSFANDLCITFDPTGLWQEIASISSIFPESLDVFFTKEIKKYTQQNYPNDLITGITRTFWGCLITLQSNKQLTFDYGSNFLGEALHVSQSDELPTTIKQFISQHFPEVKYRTIIKHISINEEDEYEHNYIIWLDGNIKLVFDSNNNWKELDGYNKLLPASFIESLPEKVKEYLANHYPDAEITSIVLSYSSRYTIQVSETQRVVIDPERDATVIETEKINEFINQHFTDITSKMISFPADWIVLIIRVELCNGFDIELDEYYQWISINGNGIPFPKSLQNLLPAEINTYIATKTNGEILKMEKTDSGYRIVLTDGEGLLFSFKGEFIGNEEVPTTPYGKTYQYIRSHFPKELTRSVTYTAGSGWTYTLSNKIEVKFNLEGDLIES